MKSNEEINSRGNEEEYKLEDEDKNDDEMEEKGDSAGEMMDSHGRRGGGCGRRGKKKGKCARPGPVTRNAYLNFLRDFRKKACGMSMIETTKAGAKKWRHLNDCEKKRYEKMACNAPKRKRKNHLRGFCKSLQKMKCAPKKKRCGPARKKRRARSMSKCGMKRRVRRHKKKVC